MTKARIWHFPSPFWRVRLFESGLEALLTFTEGVVGLVMDLVFRIVLDFLLRGRSTRLRVSYNDAASTLLVQDDESPLEKKKFRTWALLLSRPVPPEQLEALDNAVTHRDIIGIKLLLRAAVHRTCSRIRIVSQELGVSRGMHVVWISELSNITATSKTCVMQGTHAPYDVGTTIAINVHSVIRPWLGHAHLFFPQLVVDQKLFEEQGDVLQAINSLASPRRDDHHLELSSESPSQTTPTHHDEYRFGSQDTPCCACEKMFSEGLMLISGHCGHTVCLRCASVCARRHVLLPGATPRNLPCPAIDCESMFTSREVQSLITCEDFDTLELNEVRLALSDGVMCPVCSALFERVLNDVRYDDPLREKFVCGACGADFCAQCCEAPFHMGRGCRLQYSENAPRCRFCRNQASSTLAGANDVHTCDSAVCVARGKRCCTMPKPCGHPCRGVIGERNCVRCLDPTCASKHPVHEEDDLCAICYVESLIEAPCLELQCGHVFHEHCLIEKLNKKWPTARITFSFTDCPLCATPIHHHLLAMELQSIQKFKEGLEARFMERLKLDGLLSHPSIQTPTGKYYERPMDYAREQLTYFQCYQCAKPYFGGLRECFGADREEPNREELVCGGCSAGSASCTKHGAQHLEFKCKYCCNLAVWFCWGTTHFCDTCHSPPRKSVRCECPGEELCPIKGKHLPNGTECAIGCAMCRSESVN